MSPIGDTSHSSATHLSPLPVESLKFHSVDPSTVPHVNDDPDWVDAPIPVSTPVFQTPSAVTDHNPINNQLAEAL